MIIKLIKIRRYFNMENNDELTEKIVEKVKECCDEKIAVSKTPIENRWNITIKDKPSEA